MLIEFSKPNTWSDWIETTAREVAPDGWADIKWTKRMSARFTLHVGERNAPAAAVDIFFRKLYMVDPQAVVRTARALYRGKADFEKQKEAERVQA